jgi:hypothetical protein
VTRQLKQTDLRRYTWLIAGILASLPFFQGTLARNLAAPSDFADPSFQQLWARTDQPVSMGQVQRSWYWGPQAGETRSESYSGSPTGTRLVQYFDKARMEINNPNGDRSSPWFVTTGLLVAEMVSGKEQIGDKEYRRLAPAEIAVGGDGLESDPDAPTYTSFRPVASLSGPGANRAPSRTGQSVTATISRAGKVADNIALGLYTGARLVAYSDVLGHNIPQAMWDFLNMKGTVSQNGALVGGQTLADWVFVMGYPITEPYWARVKINGVYADVLFQMYERRSLAYIPSLPKEWQVQMGNVGVHYHRWLYGGPLPSPVVPLPPSAQSPPTLPPAVDGVITPTSAPLGTPLSMSMSGFRPGEEIVSWFTSPDGEATDAHINPRAALDGTVSNLPVPTARLSTGQWAITFHGKASNHESIAYFYLFPPDPSAPTATATPFATSTTVAQPTGSVVSASPTYTATPAPQGTISPTPSEPPVPTEPAEGVILSIHPPYGPPDGQFSFEARGFAPGEALQVKFTDPNRNIVYPAGSNNGHYQAGPDGRLSFALVPTQAFPAAPTGSWLFEVDGLQSGLQGVTGFALR